MQHALNKLRARVPSNIVLLTLIICLLGALNISSAAQATRPNLYWVQLLWVLIGAGSSLVIVLLKTRTLGQIAYAFYGFVLFLLLLVLAIGSVAKGGQRWIDLGFFRMQPSELAKLAVILATAKFCSEYKGVFGYRLRDLIRPFNMSRPMLVLAATMGILTSEKLQKKLPFTLHFDSIWVIVGLLFVLVVVFLWSLMAIDQLRKEGFHLSQLISVSDLVLLPFLLIAVEPDLGTALIVLAISGSIVLFVGIRKSSMLIALLSFIGVALFAWNVLLMDYQKMRVLTFMNPDANIRSHGYHAAQSLIAIGSGKIFGKGYREGTQTQLSFLPENHTDFALAVWAEEWGFVAAFVLVLLFLALVLSMVQFAAKVQDRFGQLLVIGSAAMVFWHVAINMGMVTGLLPVVGVPLPFVSYGGASMLTQMAAIALCINVAVWRQIK